MARAPTDIRSIARQHTPLAIETLAMICRGSESDSARVGAAVALLDRGWGKAPQAHTGEDGEGDIKVIVRHIVRGVVTDERPLKDVTKVTTIEGK